MQLSYWEQKEWLNGTDFAIIGAGFVGCFTALELRRRFPKAKISLFESGMLPNGASTKNAGFACFGSPSELLADLEQIPEQEVWETVKMRKKGIDRLQEWVTPKEIDLAFYGGYELFPNKASYQKAEHLLPELNMALQSIFSGLPFKPISTKTLPFRNVFKTAVLNPFEGQLNPAKLIRILHKKMNENNISVFFGAQASNVKQAGEKSLINFNGFFLQAKKTIICTNGFASQLGVLDVEPARAQVLITEPITDLSWKGCFHLNQGFDYFRNVGDRILLGGGRNLDLIKENSMQKNLNPKIQAYLEELLHTSISPFNKVQIAQRWSGIMGVGSSKKPIVKKINATTYAAVRMGGMGVAIAPIVGQQVAELIYKSH